MREAACLRLKHIGERLAGLLCCTTYATVAAS